MSEAKKMIDQKTITEFVNRIETKKNFKRNPDKVFRHIVSELGELDSAIHAIDQIDARPESEFITEKNLRGHYCAKVADELLDIIFLACLMADIYAVDLNEAIPARMADIARQYGVKLPEEKKNGRS